MTTWVPQRYDNDCLIAALAMAMDVPYEAVVEHVGFPQGVTPGKTTALAARVMERVLARCGYAWLLMFPETTTATPWPPEPYARTHIVSVGDTYDIKRGGHAVMMDAYGRIFDPLRRPGELEGPFGFPDDRKVQYVAGLFPVR